MRAVEVKEMCVSVGTRRPGEEQRSGLEEGWGEGPSGPLRFLSVAPGTYF